MLDDSFVMNFINPVTKQQVNPTNNTNHINYNPKLKTFGSDNTNLDPHKWGQLKLKLTLIDKVIKKSMNGMITTILLKQNMNSTDIISNVSFITCNQLILMKEHGLRGTQIIKFD